MHQDRWRKKLRQYQIGHLTSYRPLPALLHAQDVHRSTRKVASHVIDEEGRQSRICQISLVGKQHCLTFCILQIAWQRMFCRPRHTNAFLPRTRQSPQVLLNTPALYLEQSFR